MVALIFSFIVVNRDYFKSNGVYGVWIILLVIFVIIIIGLIGLFCYFHYKYPWKRWMEKLRCYDDVGVGVGRQRRNNYKIFYMPFCPYLPCCMILLNSYIIAGIGLQMMGELMLVLALGIPIYFVYSYKHSELRKQRLTKQVSSMIALTAVNDQTIQDDNDDVTITGHTVETAIT